MIKKICLCVPVLLFIIASLCLADEKNPVVGTVTDTWGKKVVKIQFNDPATVKLKDIYYLYRGDKVVGKVQVYDHKKDSFWASLLEDTGPAAKGDLVKKEGEVAAAKPIDPADYDKLVFPIFVETCAYDYAFIGALENLFNSVMDPNDPDGLKKLNKSLQTPGSEGWMFYVTRFQKIFNESDTKKILVQGDAFFSKSIDSLKAVRPPEALQNAHNRLLALLGNLKVCFSAFKDIPPGSGVNDYNHVIRVHNQFFSEKGNLLKYTRGSLVLISQVIEEYFEYFPEWKDKDPRAKYKKTI